MEQGGKRLPRRTAASPPASRPSRPTHLVRKPHAAVERIDLHACAVLSSAADVLEQEDQGVDRLQRGERLGVERVEVVLLSAQLPRAQRASSCCCCTAPLVTGFFPTPRWSKDKHEGFKPCGKKLGRSGELGELSLDDGADQAIAWRRGTLTTCSPLTPSCRSSSENTCGSDSVRHHPSSMVLCCSVR